VGDNPYVVVLTVLWVTGIVSGLLDNIPLTITMVPIVRTMLEATPIPNDILWWALALGACFGGNLTLIGASANIVSVGIAKQCNAHISFLEFAKTSVPVALLTLVVSSIYLCIYLWWSL
jgi:Na+/H+ antiporter NhaD/arsenite permease-like protein